MYEWSNTEKICYALFMEITEDLADTSRESVFITGASGCVGHYLIKQCLLHTDWQIHVLVRVPERLKFSEEEKKRVTVHQGDFRKIEAFEPVIKKMNYIIHHPLKLFQLLDLMPPYLIIE